MDQWVSEGLIEADPSPSCEHDQARGLLFWEPAAPLEKNTGWGWRAPGQGQQGRSGLPFMGSGFPHMSLGWKEGDGSMAYPLGEQRSLCSWWKVQAHICQRGWETRARPGPFSKCQGGVRVLGQPSAPPQRSAIPQSCRRLVKNTQPDGLIPT